MTFAALRRSAVCIGALFILTTIFLAATRIASSLDFSASRSSPARDVPAPPRSPADAPMSYGLNARPGFTDLSVHIASLPERHRPSRAHPGRRLVIVGDVHGMHASLERLLDELRFAVAAGDHLVLAGDMINKGPDSPGVLDLAIRLGASAVRGNHEDRVLLAHRSMQNTHVANEDAHGNPVMTKGEEIEGQPKAEEPKDEPKSATAAEVDDNDEEEDDLEPAVFSHGDSQERATARRLSRKHLAWLASLPVILEAGTIEGLGDLVIVHAGLVPGVPLPRQDPWAVMNMRGLVYPREELRRQEAKRALEDARKAYNAASLIAVGPITETMVEREHERRRRPGDREPAIPTDRHDGASSWPKAWDAHQRALPEATPRTVVAYGHDSKRGLHVGQYTFGLDSGCVNGGELSALVIEATAEGVTHVVRSVSCAGDEGKKKKRKGRKHKKGKKSKKQEDQS
ncbi:calcineurin-like phosphoesterase [Colletotrichum graminicola]|uniref:Calcineurin-like phosphoesterase n=1 Tax=Colletotrichum graminicola (strain M1.001 / M2 / FGSC 10212) TaxID=645133 RepID=E3QVW1_COLGM|nr:calcineurin-like phosphoesterase [Colletotrichum graminicola M1.001]EFQ34999.1 calcineurin-like phosphoesterase [Colletotrichum graminicola M1.001]WDK18159.1 calcineurin-like phosphoesterase [Colletotrichum graminicola]